MIKSTICVKEEALRAGNLALKFRIHEDLATKFGIVLSEPVPDEMLAIFSTNLDMEP